MGYGKWMKPADVIALPFQRGSELRHRKLFHPRGVLMSGRLERTAPEGEGLPLVSGPIIGRVSKALGAPGRLPDIGGLAWRMETPEGSGKWDILLASVVHGPLSRAVLRPILGWTGSEFSTLMPLAHDDELWWLRARITSTIDGGGLALTDITRRASGEGLDITVEQALKLNEFQPLARLHFDGIVSGEDISFDPVVNEPEHVRLTPQWLTDFRRAAYRRSREDRDAPNRPTPEEAAEAKDS